MSNVKITLNHAALKNLDQAAIRALSQTGTAVMKRMKNAQVIPFRMGHLQNDSSWVDDSHASQGQVELVFSTPYARRLYYHPEYNFTKEHNPNAKAHWTEDWEPGGIEEDYAQRAFEKIYKREAGL